MGRRGVGEEGGWGSPGTEKARFPGITEAETNPSCPPSSSQHSLMIAPSNNFKSTTIAGPANPVVGK